MDLSEVVVMRRFLVDVVVFPFAALRAYLRAVRS